MALVLKGDTKTAYLSLSKEVRREVDKQMASIAVQVDKAVDTLVNDIENYTQSNVGLPKARIEQNLNGIRRAGGGMFDDASRKLTGAMTDKVFAVSDDIFFGKLKTEDDFPIDDLRFTWTAVLVNTCPDCLPLHGTSRTMKRWENTGGVPNERDTVCTIRGKCHCTLIPSDTMPSKKDMVKPIKVQAARIRKAEKKRGKRYAKTTRTGFMGQVNSITGTISDLRKIKKVN